MSDRWRRLRPDIQPRRINMHQPAPSTDTPPQPAPHPLRFHRPHMRLDKVFGSDWFALKAEACARFFGTPVSLISQTVVLRMWIVLNALVPTKIRHFDEYSFSLQASYASPRVSLAQARQADRHNAHAQADLLDRDTWQTGMAHELSRRIDQMTTGMHAALERGAGALRVEAAGPAGGGARA